MHQLSPQDAQFLYSETAHNLTHVTSISVLDPATVPGKGTVRFKAIIEHVRRRLAYNPLFFCRLVRLPLEFDYPYWVEDEYFELEYHLQHGRLPAPGDSRQFCIHMARYHSRPLDMNRPPWEMSVVEGLDNVEGLPPGCFALVTKIHHALGDGAALTRFFTSLMDADNRGTPLVPLTKPEEEPAALPPLSQLLKRALKANFGSPVRVAETLMRSAPGIYRAVRAPAERDGDTETTVPSTRFNGSVSPHKVFDLREYALDDLRSIRQLHPGVTINDVVLAICSGALRRYLSHHRELPESPLIAWVPINARPKSHAGEDVPGNNITAMTAPIFTEESDPLKRLRKIHRATQASKAARSGISARLMTDVTQHIPAATQVLAARLLVSSGLAAKMCNLFVSNVPGPQVPTYMAGARVLRTAGMAPLAEGMGLFIATPSYDGRISFGVTSTREILPDVSFFMDCIDEALAELLSLAAGVGAGRARRKAAPAKRGGKRSAAAGRSRISSKAAAPKKSPGKRKAAPKRSRTSGR